MADLQVVYDQLTAIVWRDGMPDSAHSRHSADRGYHRHCPICNGQLMRVLEAAAPLLAAEFREEGRREAASLIEDVAGDGYTEYWGMKFARMIRGEADVDG